MNTTDRQAWHSMRTLASADASCPFPSSQPLLVCRLQQTSRQLKAESQLLAQSMTLQTHRGGNGAASDLMYYMTAEGKPEKYNKSFDCLAEWVDNSLDMYKASSILPVLKLHHLAESPLPLSCKSPFTKPWNCPPGEASIYSWIVL